MSEYRGAVFIQKYFSNKTHLVNYVRYIATREGTVLNTDSGFGLWGNVDKQSWSSGSIRDLERTLERAMEASKNGRQVHSAVISLNGLVAENKGYYSRHSWEKLLNKQMPVIAKKMDISMTDLKWCASYHNEFGHPHCHIVFWDDSPKVHGRMRRTRFIRYTEDIKRSINENIFTKEILELGNSAKSEQKILDEHLTAILGKALSHDDKSLEDFTLSGTTYSPTKYGTGAISRLMKLLDTAVISIPREVNIKKLSYENSSYSLKRSLRSCVDELLYTSSELSKAYTRYIDSETERIALLADKDSKTYANLLGQSKEKVYGAISNVLLKFIIKNGLNKFTEANADIYIKSALEKLGEVNITREDLIYTHRFRELKQVQQRYRSLFGDNASSVALLNTISSIVPQMEINNTIIQGAMSDRLPQKIEELIQPLSDIERRSTAKSVAFEALEDTVDRKLSNEDIQNIALEEIDSILERYNKYEDSKRSLSAGACMQVSNTITRSMMIRFAIRSGLDISDELSQIFDDDTCQWILKACKKNIDTWNAVDTSFLNHGTEEARKYIEHKLLSDIDDLPWVIKTNFEMRCYIRQLLNITKADRKRLGEQVTRIARQELGFEDSITTTIYENSENRDVLSKVLQELREKMKDELSEAYKNEMDSNAKGIFSKNISAMRSSDIYTELLKVSPKACDIAVDIYIAKRLLVEGETKEEDAAQRKGFSYALNFTQSAMIYTQLLGSMNKAELGVYRNKLWEDFRNGVCELIKTDEAELRQNIDELLLLTPDRYQPYDTFMDDNYRNKMDITLGLIQNDDKISEITKKLMAIGCFENNGSDEDEISRILYKDTFNMVMENISDEKGWTAQFKLQATQQLILSTLNLMNAMIYNSQSCNSSDDYYKNKRNSYALMTPSQKRALRRKLRSMGKLQDRYYGFDR